jgi:hypothetical protein
MIHIATWLVNQPGGVSIRMEGKFQFPPLPLLVLGVLLFAYGFILYRRYKRLQDTPRINARSVAMGFVHVHGKTIATEVLESPITKVPCCYYSYSVEQWATGNKGSHWSPIFSDTQYRNFYLDDGTGRVLVNPAGASFNILKTFDGIIGGKQADLIQSISIQSNTPSESYLDGALGVTPPSEADLLRLKTEAVEKQRVIGLKQVDEVRKQEILKKAYPDDARYRFTEICLPVGREVGVFGTCEANPNSSDVSVIVKNPRDKVLLITSTPEAKFETGLRTRAIRLVVAGAVVLFVTFASCRPIMKTTAGPAVHSSH